MRTKLLKYYEGLTSSAEQGILTQYFDPTGRISSTVSVHSMIDTRVGAPSNINTPVIEGEVKYAEGVLGAHNIETQYEIIPAPGSTYESEYTKHWCAFHSYTPEEAVYSFVPYQGDEPFKEKKSCASYYGNGNADDATNVMASHEYAESATDPIWEAKPGWQDLEGEEVADLCATPGDELKNGSWVQGWYDDHQNACSESDESPPDILALTGTATHVTPREATLHATINPESLATTYYFEYGLTESYGTKLPTGELSAGRANVQVSSEQLSGLELEKTYHYRVVAKNSSGTTDGEDRTFIPSRSTIQVPPRESSWGEDWLNGITCVSESSCMTVGYYYNSITSPNNRALSYQLVGGQWLQREIPLNEHERSPYLTGVSCTTSNACTAVGRIELNSSDRDSALVERWNGSTWSRQEVPLPEGSLQAELYGVACVTEAECFAVGTVESSAKVWSNFSTLWHNGSWGTLTTPTSTESTESEIRGVSCGSATTCMAVGWYNSGSGAKPFSLLWEHGKWSLQTRTTYGARNGVKCISSEFCMAVGEEYGPPVVETWNGSKWTVANTAKLSDVSGGYFEGVSCTSSSNCTVVGGGFSKVREAHESAVTLAESWNGSAWTEQTTPRESERARNELTGVSCVGVAGCISVGESLASGHWGSIIEAHQEATSPSHELTFGSEGSGAGKLKGPLGIATDTSGNVWLADQVNNRVEEFNSKGSFVLVFGKEVNKTKVEAKGTEAEQNLCTAASGNVCQAGKAGSANGQLSEPQDLAFTSGGNLWVTERGNNRVQEFNTKGEYLAKFGSEGTGNGQFSEPYGIAIAASGDIWVSDARYYRVEEFTSAGEFIRKVGNNGGSGNGEFYHPTGLAIDSNGDVWVADCRNHRVQELSSNGEYISKFGLEGSAEGRFGEPVGIAIRPSGNLLIVQANPNRAQIFAPSGEYFTSLSIEGEPGGVVLGPGGTEYITSYNYDDVAKFEQPVTPEPVTQPASSVKSTEATLKGTINSGGAATTYHFEYGTTTAYGSSSSSESAGSGNEPVSKSLLISNLQPETTYHFRIVGSNTYGTNYGQDSHFTTPPSFEFSFGSSGSGAGKLDYPAGVATESAGNVWVADEENNRVAEFNSQGEFVLVFGKEVNKTKVESSGTEAEKNLCTAASGNTCQAGKAGSANGQISLPLGIAFTSSGNLWVTEAGNDRVQEFNTKGEYLAKFGSEGSGNGQFSEPHGIAIAASGDIWVSDAARLPC